MRDAQSSFARVAAASSAWDRAKTEKRKFLSFYQLKCRITWAALIKCVYEVDPLKCPKCGAEMKVVGFIEQENTDLIHMWLTAAGLWKQPAARAPPPQPESLPQVAEPTVDYEFFTNTCN